MSSAAARDTVVMSQCVFARKYPSAPREFCAHLRVRTPMCHHPPVWQCTKCDTSCHTQVSAERYDRWPAARWRQPRLQHRGVLRRCKRVRRRLQRYHTQARTANRAHTSNNTVRGADVRGTNRGGRASRGGDTSVRRARGTRTLGASGRCVRCDWTPRQVKHAAGI